MTCGYGNIVGCVGVAGCVVVGGYAMMCKVSGSIVANAADGDVGCSVDVDCNVVTAGWIAAAVGYVVVVCGVAGVGVVLWWWWWC